MEFVANFTLKNNILLIMALINLAMAIFVISRGWKSRINLHFSLIVFCTFLWSFGLFLGRFVYDLNLSEMFENTTNISGMLIVVFILYFSRYFPYSSGNLHLWQKVLIWLPALLMVYFSITGGFITETIHGRDYGEYISVYNPINWGIYASYIILLIIWAVHHLVKKYRDAEGFMKQQLKLLLLTIVIGFIFAFYFSAVVIPFGNFEYNWLGPVFSLLVNSAVFYLIFWNKEKGFNKIS